MDTMKKKESMFFMTWKRLAKNKLAVAGLIVLIITALLAVFAPIAAPYGYEEQDLFNTLAGPSREHWLGTDNLGRDMLSRLIYGGRNSLTLGLISVALAAALEGPALQAAYVTNGIAHARMLVQKGCRTYLPGGQVRPITEAITGPETLAALQHYNFTKAFMGANGVSPAEGFTTPDPEEASIKTAALQRARERWFLVDNTKFDMVYSAVIGDIGCGAILTNHCPDPRYAQLTFVKECSV